MARFNHSQHRFNLNLRAGTVAGIAEPDYDTASGPFVRVTPALLLRTAKDREANAQKIVEEKGATLLHPVRVIAPFQSKPSSWGPEPSHLWNRPAQSLEPPR